MRQIQTCTGTQSSCCFLFVVLVGLLCCLSTNALPGVELPKIVALNFTRTGDEAVISCKADPGFPDDFTLIYWLVNKTFIQMAYPEARIHEGEERLLKENGRALIQRDLIFKNIHSEDYCARYTCAVTSPAGMDLRVFQLPRKSTEKQVVRQRDWRSPRKTKRRSSRKRSLLKRKSFKL
ncbi:hypothetical protein GJAV_G00133910 [Gymnothorax javanicus]|nr:hypothetical protein GJAV_G00133910 [Gymnothorax javanicus]